MREMVDAVHEHMLTFAQAHEVDIDSSALRRTIQRQLSSALQVISEPELRRLGHHRLAFMIDTACRFDVSLGEVIHESVMDGVQHAATLCRTLQSRRQTLTTAKARPTLRLVQ